MLPSLQKVPPRLFSPRLLSCCCIVHGLYMVYTVYLFVCVCLRASGFVGSWRRVVCAGCAVRAGGVGIRGVVAGAGRGHKVGAVWKQEQQQQQQQSKQGGHVQEHNKREWIFGHRNFSSLKPLVYN